MLRRDIIFLFLILKCCTPPIFRPTTNNIGRQNKYLNISTTERETSLEKYFIIVTIEVPTNISRKRNSAPRKYESFKDMIFLLNLFPRAFKRGYTSKSPAIKIVLFFVNQSEFWQR